MRAARDRRADVVEMLKAHRRVQNVIDHSGLEYDGLFLEGTGALVFDTANEAVRPIYHTNVLMCVATEFAMVGFDMLTDPLRAVEVRARLEESGREVIALSSAQIAEFAGNAIELSGRDGRVLALSERAARSLRDDQRRVIERSARLLPLEVPTIECAGGSVRCMVAGIHLAPRTP